LAELFSRVRRKTQESCGVSKRRICSSGETPRSGHQPGVTTNSLKVSGAVMESMRPKRGSSPLPNEPTPVKPNFLSLE
jgi:hypothetical protein